MPAPENPKTPLAPTSIATACVTAIRHRHDYKSPPASHDHHRTESPTTSARARHEGRSRRQKPSGLSPARVVGVGVGFGYPLNSCSAMRITHYQRLSSEREGGARAGAARAWWAALTRRAARLCAARRRWSARRLWGGRRAALPLPAKAAARYEYDSASYARNFDDGTWMAEEGVSWHARSFGACRLAVAAAQ